MRRILTVLAVVGAGSAWAATCTFTNVVANTPETAWSWTDSGNWQDGTVPAAGDAVRFNPPGALCYVKAEGAIARTLSSAGSSLDKLYLFGDSFLFSDYGDTASRVNLANDIHIFADSIQIGTESEGTVMPYVSGVHLCGPVRSYQQFVSASGYTRQRLDTYATSSDPMRTNDLWIAEGKSFHPGSGHVRIYAPLAADQLVGQWNQTEGSPFIHRASSTELPVAPGAVVTGEGIPEGTFIRRLFDSATLELSQSATSTVAANTLTFGAIQPVMRMHVAHFERQGATTAELKFLKKANLEVAELEFDQYVVGTGGAGQISQYGVTANEMSDVNGAYRSGTYVFHKVGSNGNSGEQLYNAHFVFAGTDAEETSFGVKQAFSFGEASAVARMTVPTVAKRGWIGNFASIGGTLVKDGPGRLTIGLRGTSNAGAVTVEEGSMQINVDTDSHSARLGTLTVKSGATFSITSAFTLTVGSLVVEPGATLCGGGTIRVGHTTEPLKACTIADDGTRVVMSASAPGVFVDGEVEAAVVGHPAFWVDASKPETVEYTTEGDVNYVTRWNDCRAGEPMFCTNIAARPTFVNGSAMTEKYVRLGNVNTVNYNETEALVWSVPLAGVKAVFLVQDPREGGGEILGASKRLTDQHQLYFGTQGGPYYRGGSLNRGGALISANYATPCVKEGRFFINGEEVTGYAKGYPANALTLVEHHVNTNFAANANHYELWIDAFGAGYADKNRSGSDFIRTANGGMRISEYIIYTNSLTYAERVQVAMYLSRKWLGKDVVYNEVDRNGEGAMGDLAAVGEEVEVPEGGGAAAGNVTGAGGLTKTGAGTLYLGGVAGGNVHVKEGEVRMWGLSLANDQPVPGAWLHVDADDASTMVIENNKVTRWNDVSGNGVSLRPLDYGGRSYPGKRVENVFNGRAVLDLGTCNGADKASYRYYKADGTCYAHDNSGSNSYMPGTPSVKDAFYAFGSTHGGGSLFGNWNNGYPSQGFPHEHKTADTPLLWVGDYWKMAFGDNGFSNQVANGTSVFRINNEIVDPFTTAYSRGYDLLWFTSASGKVSDTFGTYGQNDGYVGGVEYGEIILYTNKLTDAEAQLVNAYLNKKWFNRDLEDCGVARPTSLVVDAGATVKLVNGDVVETSGLGGGGQLQAGEVQLAEDGALVAQVGADGAVGTLALTGTLKLPANARVTFAGDVAKLAFGTYTLVDAASVAGTPTAWTVESPEGVRAICSVRTTTTGVVLNVSAPGTKLFLR